MGSQLVCYQVRFPLGLSPWDLTRCYKSDFHWACPRGIATGLLQVTYTDLLFSAGCDSWQTQTPQPWPHGQCSSTDLACPIGKQITPRRLVVIRCVVRAVAGPKHKAPLEFRHLLESVGRVPAGGWHAICTSLAACVDSARRLTRNAVDEPKYAQESRTHDSSGRGRGEQDGRSS